jgi:hypothetical protein
MVVRKLYFLRVFFLVQNFELILWFVNVLYRVLLRILCVFAFQFVYSVL